MQVKKKTTPQKKNVLSEDLPVDEGVAEVIGGLLSKVHSAPSHKSEAVVHLGFIAAWIALQWGLIFSG